MTSCACHGSTVGGGAVGGAVAAAALAAASSASAARRTGARRRRRAVGRCAGDGSLKTTNRARTQRTRRAHRRVSPQSPCFCLFAFALPARCRLEGHDDESRGSRAQLSENKFMLLSSLLCRSRRCHRCAARRHGLLAAVPARAPRPRQATGNAATQGHALSPCTPRLAQEQRQQSCPQAPHLQPSSQPRTHSLPGSARDAPWLRWASCSSADRLSICRNGATRMRVIAAMCGPPHCQDRWEGGGGALASAAHWIGPAAPTAGRSAPTRPTRAR